MISVCNANYNGIGLIDECIASVRGQTGGVPVEILVHDDASTDGSAAHIREKHPEMRLIASRENVGFCVANNRMAAAARGEYLLLLNNDATLLPDALATLQAEAARLARPAILTLPQYDAATGKLLDIGCLLDPFLNPVPNRDPARGDVGTVHGACLWIPKALWEELGGFPEWFGSVAEDLYLCCRARLAGYAVRAPGVSGYRHRVGKSFGGGKALDGRLVTTYRRRALSERNKTFVMAACYPSLPLAALFPLHLVLIHIEGALLSAVRCDARLWRSVYAPLLPRLWAERSRLCRLRQLAQAARKIGVLAWLQPFHWLPWKLRLLLRHGVPEIRP
jgi:GT2 family glycosyltransferase